MSNIDSVGKSIIDKKKQEKGNLKIKVVDICNNNPIESTEIKVGHLKGTTNNSGETEFKDIPAKNYSIRAKKHYSNEDYIKFISHNYPKVVWQHKAISKNSSRAEVEDKQTTNVEIKLEVYRLINKIAFKRLHIDPPDDYGHWWIEIDSNESYGWWPKYKINDTNNLVPLPTPPTPPSAPPANAGRMTKIKYMADKAVYEAQYKLYELKKAACELRNTEAGQLLAGVEGELNGQTSYQGGSATEDPHDGDPADEEYNPVIHDCRTVTDIQNQIRNFANSYIATYGNNWSYRGERFDNSCHTFQIRAMNDCNLDKVKEV